MKGLRDKIDELNVLCHSLTALRALRHLGEHCVFVFGENFYSTNKIFKSSFAPSPW